MNEAYRGPIDEASRVLVDAVMKNETSLVERACVLDSTVLELVRAVGKAVLEHVLDRLSAQVERDARARGLTVERRKEVRLRTLLGQVAVVSPYLRNRETRETARPVRHRMGLTGGMKTAALERALTDFGAEESFELASKRVAEHYGQEVGRTSILRVVSKRAEEARSYVQKRLDDAAEAFDEPIAKRAGVDALLVELDGSMLRTGSLEPDPKGGVTPVRGIPARKRPEAWREVRVGFVRGPEESGRTYIARMEQYPVVVGDLFSAAVDRGLSVKTKVWAVSDGGNGLRGELAAQFPNLTFILDRPHLKGHLWEAAAAVTADRDAQQQWVESAIALIDAGDIKLVIAAAEKYGHDDVDRMRQLAGYLTRFSDAVGYEQAHDAGIPLGSGEIESAHRYIPQKRMKIPGACWHPSSINPMLALRILRANGWWDDFWKSRQTAAA
ncbi:MAG: UPF0236 family protein [Myxococcales bacterium]|nr:UPF0236 family protein [Myxococcales bacterium]